MRVLCCVMLYICVYVRWFEVLEFLTRELLVDGFDLNGEPRLQSLEDVHEHLVHHIQHLC